MAEILGIVTSLVGPAIELGKCVIGPIKRQINYLCCFNSNIKSLREQAKRLDDAKVGLQMRVATAENNAQVIFPEVKAWLTSANTQIEANLTEIENEILKVQSGFFTMKSRFSLSRKARKTTEAMKELLEHSKFNLISEPIPPLAIGSIPLGPTYEFESRKQIEEDIMEALRGKEVKIMGICGMGGVGKTMMAKRIMNRVKEEHLFDEVVMSVVSQQADVMKIQREIAESLGLSFEVETSSVRAHKLRARLKSTKRILIVLDDLWKRLKLEDLGFESGDEGNCTILLTSRDRSVLNAMEAEIFFVITTLSEREAWFLFREKVGGCVDDLSLLSIAKEVANECRGLPIALITVGSALKDNKVKPIWVDVLQQLKDSNPTDMPDVLRDVYTPLRLSYDFLDSQHAKTLFLLCCLFPDDYDISLEYLTMYCTGLHMFEGIRNLEQVRNRVIALVELLKNRFLLLEGYKKHHVAMHDVIRDVAIYIASKERLIDLVLQRMNWSNGQYSYSDCKWISLLPTKESGIPNPMLGLNFPSLGLFMMHGPHWEEFEIEDFHFFEGMKELNVFSSKYISWKSLPQTMQMLKNLRTLHLENCSLEGIAVVGELSSLEILSCHNCYNLAELPVEIGRLNRLKLLDFSNCIRLRTIVPGTMSNLVALEELKMIRSFKGWEVAEVSGERHRNVSLNELQSLSNLTCLEIEVGDYTLASEEIHLSPKIVKYRIGIGIIRFVAELLRNYEKNMVLSLPRKIALGNWVQLFVKNTECLHLEGDGLSNFDLSQAHNLKSLSFSDCWTVKNLVNTTASIHRRKFVVFPVLENLRLSHLPNLEEICQGPIPQGSISFKNLREFRIQSLASLKTLWKSPNQIISLGNLSSLYIESCAKLLNLFPLTMAKGLLQLEKLNISGCEMMEELFSNEENGIASHITFPKLKELRLDSLQNLTTLCKGIESIEFPALIDMTVMWCPKLMSCVSSTINYENSGGDHDGADEDSFHLFYNQKVSFPVLEFLRLSHVRNLEDLCDSPIAKGSNFFKNLKGFTLFNWPTLKYLWTSPNIKENISLNINTKDGLLQLEKLEIINCEMMEQVLFNEEDKYQDHHHPTFPKLKSLELRRSPNLTTFSRGIEIIDFPVLYNMHILDCPKLTSIVSPIDTNDHDDDTFHLFCNQKVTFGGLRYLEIGGYNNISKIWCHRIPDGFFIGLWHLEIIECDGIMSLLSSTIARNLVNLRELRIARCKEMVKVIEDEEEIIKETCPFSRLEKIMLTDLPKLGSFCEWRCELELPNLDSVVILRCPLMETFTMGTVTTPKLRRFQVDSYIASDNFSANAQEQREEEST